MLMRIPQQCLQNVYTIFAFCSSYMSMTKNHKKDLYYPKLPYVEVAIYFMIYSGVILGSIFSLHSSSALNEHRYFAYGQLSEGWKWLTGHYKDTVDFEWSFWEKHLWKTVVIGYTGHFLVARFADAVIPDKRFKVYFVYSFCFTIYYLGLYGMLFMLAHYSLQYSVAVLTKNIKACWATGCLLAYSILDSTCATVLKRVYDGDTDTIYFLLFATAMCNLRYIAFSIEYVWSCERKNAETPTNKPMQNNNVTFSDTGIRQRKPFTEESHESETKLIEHSSNQLPLSFFDLLVYQMYYPLLYGGPVINYNEFIVQMRKPPKKWDLNDIKAFSLGMLRYAMWHFITDLILHFFYISALSSDSQLLQDLPLFSLLGTALAQVIFFYLKYVCMYGIPSHFATSDNMDVPKGPHCVIAKHRITDMWKYFDKGLHLWLVRYIYIPCGGSKVGIFRSILNSILPFAFVCFWHGAYLGQICWACTSWIGVFLETFAYKLYRTDECRLLEAKYLTPAWSRRIRALFSSPMLFLLLTSNLYFLSGVTLGHLYWRRLYLENIGATAMMLVFFYCGCQSCMEFDRLGIEQM